MEKHSFDQYQIPLNFFLFGFFSLLPAKTWAGAGLLPHLGDYFVYFLLGMYTVIWLGSWGFLKFIFLIINRNKRPDSKASYWLFNKTIPIGLRLLSLTQFILSYFYVLIGLIHLGEGHDTYNILVCLVFSVLLIVSASGYVHRSYKYGYVGGIMLSLLFLTNGLVYLFFYRIYGAYGVGIDVISPVPFSPLYGLLLICFLIFRYDVFFNNEVSRNKST